MLPTVPIVLSGGPIVVSDDIPCDVCGEPIRGGMFHLHLDLRVLIARLRSRAETSRGNARAYRAEGYHAEALLQEARASAYELAAEDAEGFEKGDGS